jgi:hypothetical protein
MSMIRCAVKVLVGEGLEIFKVFLERRDGHIVGKNCAKAATASSEAHKHASTGEVLCVHIEL